jgi:hypothetical protein
MAFAASFARRSREEKSMKVQNKPIDPARLRSVPQEGFSWIDRRFVREGFIDRLPGEAILLYFFLVAVSDAQGLSFYADPTIGKILKLNPGELTQARARLIKAELILHHCPLYQVLPLPQKAEPTSRPPFNSSPVRIPRGGEPMSLGEILRLASAKTTGLESLKSAGKGNE